MKRLLKLCAIPTAMALLGAASNALVMRANGGMPAYLNYPAPTKRAYEILGLPYPHHTALEATTQYRVLADILGTYSIGDVLIAAGLVGLVFACFYYELVLEVNHGHKS